MDLTGDDDKRLVTAFEKLLRTDHDGSMHATILEKLDSIIFRLDSELKKLHQKSVHQQIQGARRAVNNAIITMKIVQANRESMFKND